MKINQDKVEYAVKVLEQLATDYKNGFPKEMKGDISSFGASIIQAGILPSVLFYCEGEYTDNNKSKSDNDENEDEGTKKRRAKLMKVIYDVMNVGTSSSKRPLVEYVRKNLDSKDALDRITESALAVKIALRAFKFDEKAAKSTPKNPVAP